MIYLELFWAFFKVGLLTLGGGLASIPLLRHLGLQTGWFETSFLTEMIGISESTPGPIGINMATYVGIHVGGILGGLVATLGMVAPSLIIVLLISHFLMQYKKSKLSDDIFKLIRPVVAALIAVAGVDILIIAIKNIELASYYSLLTFALLLGLILKTKWNPIVYIIISAIIGIVFKLG